ncbi:DsbA family protein [Lactiplantibacillus sp. WILCCON 0030]|uniref:DsbA family protein n=1 Tax=Lactiplantibacillus brownii TaxID=3069269 RepID=A0ABU1AB89_9LACO|nr:DsbA family protein [Lactiplantibacillus brownii]MDQ7937653.1 DsbA family protein [Lactiplantibacillus brownii]
MLEVYLFVNPLATQCVRDEQNVLRLANDSDKQIQFQFVPLLNINVVQKALKNQGFKSSDWQAQNQQSQTLYRVILDYKAALFQGKKRGRNFLIAMQAAMLKAGQHYSEDLVKTVAAESHIDLDMFMEDRNSKLAKQAFHADQRLASEMNITEASSAVVFDCDQYDYGVLLEHFNYATLFDLVNGHLDPFHELTHRTNCAALDGSQLHVL